MTQFKIGDLVKLTSIGRGYIEELSSYCSLEKKYYSSKNIFQITRNTGDTLYYLDNFNVGFYSSELEKLNFKDICNEVINC